MTDSDQKLFTEVERDYENSRNRLTSIFSASNGYEDLYWGYLKNSANPWKSNVFDPEVFQNIERVTSHLTASYPRGKFLPQEGSDTADAKVADEVYKYQWRRPEQDAQLKLQKLIKGMGIFGTSWALLTWRYERRKKKYPSNDEGTEFEEREEVVWDDPYLQDLNFYDCFPDPSATSEEDMEYFIHNDYVTLDELRAANFRKYGQVRYKNLSELEDLLKGDKDYAAEAADPYRNKVDTIRGVTTTGIHRRIQIRRRYRRDRWVTIVPKYNLVIEDRDNPFWHGQLPVHGIFDQVYPGQLYAVGEVQMVEKLQRGLNNVINQRLDNVRLLLNPVVQARGSTKYAKQWKWKPGQIWQVDNQDDIKQFQLTDVTGNTFANTVAFFKDSMSKGNGMVDFLTKREGSIQKLTAAQVNAGAGEQNARLKAKENNVDIFITHLSNQWMQLNQQYLTKPRAIRIAGKEALAAFAKKDYIDKKINYRGKQVPKFNQAKESDYGFLIVDRSDLLGSFDFVVEAGSTTATDTASEVQNTIETIGLLKGLQPQLQSEGVEVKFQPLVEDVLIKTGFKNVDSIIQAIKVLPTPTAPAPQFGATGMPPAGMMPPQMAPSMNTGMIAPGQPMGNPQLLQELSQMMQGVQPQGMPPQQPMM